MMMGDKKKVAAIIIKGLGNSAPQMSSKDKHEFAEYPEEKESKEDFNKHGIHAAMEKFIKAVHDKDSETAVEAFMECKECAEGYSMDYENSYMGSDKED